MTVSNGHAKFRFFSFWRRYQENRHGTCASWIHAPGGTAVPGAHGCDRSCLWIAWRIVDVFDLSVRCGKLWPGGILVAEGSPSGRLEAGQNVSVKIPELYLEDHPSGALVVC
jgi:hypothetical protein